MFLQQYVQLIATIHAAINVIMNFFLKNYIYLHNKLQVVVNDENEHPYEAYSNFTETTIKLNKSETKNQLKSTDLATDFFAKIVYTRASPTMGCQNFCQSCQIIIYINI